MDSRQCDVGIEENLIFLDFISMCQQQVTFIYILKSKYSLNTHALVTTTNNMKYYLTQT